MRTVKLASLVLGGMAAGIALVIACGDDMRAQDAGAADGATCDCPTPEPIENRIRYVRAEKMWPAHDNGGPANLGADCTDFGLQARVLGGTCLAGTEGVTGVREGVWSGGYIVDGAPTFVCSFRNTTDFDVPVKATATCLVPEGTPSPDGGM